MKGGGCGDGTSHPAEMSEIELPEVPAEPLAESDPAEAAAETAPGPVESDPAPDPAPTQHVEVGRWAGLRGRLWAAVTLPRVLLVLIAAGAATGYAWSMNTSGLETYYAAGVRSMSESWHSFFYDAFDPHATITLDKLPGAFWIQALSVRCFGYSVWAIVLPQVVESTLTVLVLYRAVRRTAGSAAALTAAALLAASPVTLASTRGDLAEPLYLLCIVLAADATLRAVTTGRRRSWYVAGAWVAAGFQAKMTEAWLVLPILALVMVLAAARGRRRAVLRAGVWAGATAAVSLVWVCCFALTPSADRPYADGSTNNSIFAQVFVYNGEFRFGSGEYIKPLADPGAEAVEVQADNDQAAGAGFYPASELTDPGWDRLLTGTLARDCDWIALLAVGGAAAGYAARRRAGRGDPARAAIVLWSTWLVGYGAVFSSAHRIQGYYLATLIPAMAALAATGAWTLWRAARASHRAGILLSVLILGQAAWAAWLLHGAYLWVSVLILCAAVVAAGLPVLRRSGAGRRLVAGAAALALLAGPVGASVWLEIRAGGPFDTAPSDQGTLARPSLSASAGRASTVGGYGATIHGQYISGQWATDMLEGATEQAQLDTLHGEILVFSSAEASDYILFGETGILPVGGFTGDVPYPSVDQVKQLIASDKIAYAVVPADTVLTANDPRVLAVEQTCRPLEVSVPAAAYRLYGCEVS